MAAYPEDDVTRRFTHHPPTRPGVAELHEHVRGECADLATELNRIMPSCYEARRAIDAVDDACKHANAAVARWMNYEAAPVPAVGDLEASRVAEILAQEVRGGESVSAVMLRLLDELMRYRGHAAASAAMTNGRAL